MIEKFLAIKLFLDNLSDSLLSMFKVIVLSNFRLKFPKYTNKVAVLLGNGPSLNSAIINNIDFLKRSEMFCVNLFSISEYFLLLKPQNYFLLDPAFIDPKHEGANSALIKLIEKTSWPINLYIQNSFSKSKYFMDLVNQNKNLNLIFFNYVIFEGFDTVKYFFYKNNLGMPQCQNVLVALVFQCINLTFEKIFILGADHTWHETLRLNENNELIFNDTHFYGEKKYNISPDLNQNNSYLAKQFLAIYKVFKGYENLAKYAKYRGVNIYNASTKSYIDVFEKIKL